MALNRTGIESELTFRTSRSGGAGGQHVNKVETKVELLFDLHASGWLSNTQKARIQERLSTRINKEGVLKVTNSRSRSQAGNKALAIERFFELLEKALIVRKKRKPTKVSKAAKERRLKAKKEHSEKKGRRRKSKY